MDDREWAGLVEEVAKMPEVTAALLRDHVADAEGRCPRCRVGAVRAVAPCRLYALAAAARDRRDAPTPG